MGYGLGFYRQAGHLYGFPTGADGTVPVDSAVGGAAGEWILFESAPFVVFSMYGGGFGTMPAFAADMFGPANVGGIYGVMLTAWSAAAVVGPFIITQLSAAARASLKPGAPKVHIYDQPLAVLAGFLAFGFILCLLVRPLKSRLVKV
ncbi:MAG TPA: hypothetical protein VHZ07_12170 [Bryobacteraceae bacterium]|nr:hypothetical protein [Bryobacteraceae bacterium]